MKKTVILALLFAQLLFTITLFAQELSWKHYTVNDGLVQSQVNTFFQDSKGYLWIGTRAGISRFDGIHFVNFTEKEGLPFKWILNITEDRNQNIWISTFQGLSCFDGQTFNNFPFDPSTSNFHFNLIVPITPDSVLLYRLQNSGELHKLLLSKGKYTFIEKISLPHDKVCSISKEIFKFDQATRTFLFTNKGGALYTINSGSVERIPIDFVKLQGFQPGPDGKIYYIDNGFLYSYSNKQATKILQETIIDSTSIVSIDLAVDNSGNIVVYDRENKNAFIINANQSRITKTNLNTSTSFPSFDREGNLWFGTENGLFKSNTLSIINYLPKKDGMKENIWSITEGKNGKMYFSSYYDGLQSLENGRFYNESKLPKTPDGRPLFLAMGSISDEEGNIYLTTNYYPIVKFDGDTYTPFYKPTILKPSFIIRRHKMDSSFLVGAHHSFYRFYKNNVIDSLQVKPGNGKSAVTTGLEVDKLNRIWLGGFNGMSLLIGDSLVHFPTNEFPFEFGGNALLRDHKANIWIGNSNGLFLYDYNTFQKIEHPLLDRFTTTLFENGDTTLFIGSLKGIVTLSLKRFYKDRSLDLIAVGKDKGFEGIEPGQNGFFKDSKGYLWLPNTDRVVRIDPALIRKNEQAPQVSISGLHVLGEKMAWKNVAINEVADLRFYIKKGEKNLKFDFIGISLRHPEGITYTHMLEGNDAGWSEPSAERTAAYTNLPPGKYSFKVKAANTDGVWTETPAILNFTVVPAIHQRFWFRIIGVFLIASLLLSSGGLFMYLRRRRQQQALENDQKMSELRLLAIQNQIEPHFTYNALNTIAAAVLREEKSVAYSYFVKLSKLMRAILQNNEQLTTTLEDEIDFVSNYVQIQQFRFNDKFEFKLDIAADINMESVIPKTCIQTFAENAIKHGLMHKQSKGNLQITIFNEGEALCIHIEDDGIGREKAKALNTSGSTNGLKIISGYFEHFNRINIQKLEFHIVDIFASDNTAAGTRIKLKIPHDFVYSKL